MSPGRSSKTESTPGAGTSPDTRRNLAEWERTAGSYEKLHHRAITGKRALAWGVWRVPESRLRLLGDVRGKNILELGCGAADWSIGLTRKGARMTALDVSPRRLAQAREQMDRAGVDFPLVEASAESLPFPARSFHIVFCDWGAMTFVDPRMSVPEVARVLRAGGTFAFSTSHPFRSVAQDRRSDRIARALRYGYHDLDRVVFPDGVEFNLPFGEWIRLFGENHLVVERLIEPRPSPGMRSTYLTPAESAWARRWPLEMIWKLTRLRGSPRAPDR